MVKRKEMGDSRPEQCKMCVYTVEGKVKRKTGRNKTEIDLYMKSGHSLRLFFRPNVNQDKDALVDPTE